MLLSTWTDQEHGTKIVPKVGTVCHRREHANLRLIRKTTDLVEPPGEGLSVIPVNFAVVLLWPAGPVLRGTGVDSCRLAQVCVRVKPGDEISAQTSCGVEDLLLRVEAASDPVEYA